jgi:C-terminal processing protease CtpA/Prc/Tol biopolymer transport system component
MNFFRFLLIFFPIFSFAQSPLLMQPAISPDAKTIAFSYQGDIWTMPLSGGPALRLTIHEGYESRPIWSPDGKNIAFGSDRNGNNDVFIVASGGGTPKQLTWGSYSDMPISWDGNENILFTTRRLFAQVERELEIYTVSTNGSTPERKLDALAMEALYSPDRNAIAIVRGTCGAEREAYRGPANRDLWIYFPKTDKYFELTNFAGNDFNVRWADDKTLYFLSSQSGRNNIYRMKLSQNREKVESVSAVTTIRGDFGILSFDLSLDGKTIVYQQSDAFYSIPSEGGNPKKIIVDIAADYRFDPVQKKSFSKMDEYSVSPNGKWIAFSVHGELFVSANDKEDSKTVRLTSGAARDRNPVWVNDKTLLYLSDQFGNYDLFAISSADTTEKELFKTLKFKTTRLTDNSNDEKNPVLSPDGKKLAFGRGRGELWIADFDSTQSKFEKERKLLEGWAAAENVSWSPDSKWLAYERSDLSFNQEVFIHHADDSLKPVNISMHPRPDGNPQWSADGRKLAFTSTRNNGDSDIWFCWLREEDYLKSREEWKREELASKDEKKDKAKDKDKNDKSVTPVKIDFKDIHLRLQQVTAYPGNESQYRISPDAKTFYYVNGRDGRRDFTVVQSLCQIKWDGTEMKELVDGKQNPGSLELSADGETLYYLSSGGSLNALKTKDAKSESRSVSAKMEIVLADELKQIFNEGWRALDEGFYDPKFHGENWKNLRALYEPLCLKASTKEDFQFFFNLMLGQLNASHMGLYAGDNPKTTQTVKTGLLGVELSSTGNGLKINKVIDGSPAAKPDSRLYPGEFILSVNGEKVSTNSDFDALMDETQGEKVLLEVVDSGKTREVVIWPAASLANQIYEDWVNERKKLTDEYSKGRLGYIHIQGMDWKSFERFERELMAAGNGKEGIVIDVRYNGGGWTTDYLMAILSVRQHSYTVPRGAAADLKEHKKFSDYYPYGERLPFAAWTKPSIALCNESSYSNAEIFSHAYKELGLGTLVGKPTYGAVISTGAYNLIDGSYVRMPFRGWFVKSSGLNMENGPAVPDVIIENSPDYKAKGKDEQLKKAVELLLQKLK